MPTFSSSAIRSAEYDGASQRLVLQFVTGGRYTFCRVPASVYDGLCNASSKGRYYDSHIRDRYQC